MKYALHLVENIQCRATKQDEKLDRRY